MASLISSSTKSWTARCSCVGARGRGGSGCSPGGAVSVGSGEEAARVVREILVQPEGRIVNALGEHPLAAPWPKGTTVLAKTGRAEDDGRAVSWLVGRVTRGGRRWIFVSCAVGSEDPMAAVSLAGARLVELKVLRD